jgi:hypothetical protein
MSLEHPRRKTYQVTGQTAHSLKLCAHLMHSLEPVGKFYYGGWDQSRQYRKITSLDGFMYWLKANNPLGGDQ